MNWNKHCKIIMPSSSSNSSSYFLYLQDKVGIFSKFDVFVSLFEYYIIQIKLLWIKIMLLTQLHMIYGWLYCFLLVEFLSELNGLQLAATWRQLVCSGCQSILFYLIGSPTVCCTLCNAITHVPPPDLEICQLLCGGCRRMLIYVCGAARVSCSSCGTVNRVPGTILVHCQTYDPSGLILISMNCILIC
ncbi:PREDICTED: uncharacterized protein LOC109340666 [Lupinus angustifolius]|uniref:uncharacterized protein LOC109340666 n=1 Tax=Lupinus angustifolius TaxID=3871 RepID=UPI00092FC53B|nr:PREDICTED: uncharacterized protein LOC109340666 [Lupinus angustifolius]